MIENPLRIIFGQTNINSIRNKFDLLMNIIKKDIDMSMISETKIGFPVSQFIMTGCSNSVQGLDQTNRKGGILSFVREDISCKTIKTDCDTDFNGGFCGGKVKKKGLLCCS